MVRTLELLSGIQVVSLVGRQGAGKTTLGKALAKRQNCPHVETSSIVKKTMPGMRLIDTHALTEEDPAWLGDAIYQEIAREHPRATKIVLTGVRELPVHITLTSYNARLQGIVIYCPAQDRLTRQIQANKCSTVQDFLNRDAEESEMGLEALFSLYPAILCANSTKPERVVDQIIEILETVKAY